MVLRGGGVLSAHAPVDHTERIKMATAMAAMLAALEAVEACVEDCEYCEGRGVDARRKDDSACRECGGIGLQFRPSVVAEIETIRAAIKKARGGK